VKETHPNDLLSSLVNQFRDGVEEHIQKAKVPEAVKWIENNFYIPETRKDPKLNGRFVLQPYQRDTIREALSRNENGDYKYSIIVWSDIKKSAKSTIAAAVNLYRAHHTDWGEFYVIANDLKQADSRVNYYLRRALTLNPKFTDKYSRLGYRTTAPHGSFIEAIPIDPSGEAGSNADMITFSELWGANEYEKQNMWAEMTLSPTKRGQSFRWVESYAGFQEESELLYSLYDLGVLRGEKLWPDKLYEVTDGPPAPLELFVNREAGMLCLWNTKPRCPWQTKEYYASEEKILPVNQFLRMHRNQWVTSTETFVPMEWWDACGHTDADWPKYDKNRHPQVIALDAAVSDDTFGVWMGCRHPERAGEVMTTFVQRWKPVQGHKVDFQGTEEKPGPELTIRRLIKDYNVVEVTYDPYQLHDMATRLKQEGLAWFRSFDQGADRLTADSQFRALIRERRFWHNGDPDFREHVQNSNAKVDIEDRRLRIVKRMEKMKIDLCVAGSMGSYEVLRLNL
jgi:phage terminase large subunit-like protein